MKSPDFYNNDNKKYEKEKIKRKKKQTNIKAKKKKTKNHEQVKLLRSTTCLFTTCPMSVQMCVSRRTISTTRTFPSETERKIRRTKAF